LKEIQNQRAVLRRSAGLRPGKNRSQTERSRVGDRRSTLALELDLAARMAEQSCNFMLWQQANANGKKSVSKLLARKGVRELEKLDQDFKAYWPLRNKATTKHCSPFLKRRVEDYLAS